MATFKTRICNKIDTYQNWIDSKLVPLAGYESKTKANEEELIRRAKLGV